MNEIKKYFTVNAGNLISLDKIVNKLINEGWQPYGSPYLLGKDVCQAMVTNSAVSAEETTATLNAMLQGFPSQIMRPKG